MIRYPFLHEGTTIGVTAPSSGVKEPLHEMVKQAIGRLIEKGYPVVCGETIWTQKKVKSAPATISCGTQLPTEERGGWSGLPAMG